MKILKILLVATVGVGVGLSIRDYRAWKYEETKNYGHGPGNKANSQMTNIKLVLYQNEMAGFRIKYPEGWEVRESSRFKNQTTIIIPRWNEIIGVGERVSVVRFGGTLDVQVENLARAATLPDLADREAAKLKLSREREYINTDRVSLTVLSWDEENTLKQRAMAVKGNKLIVIDSAGDEGVFKEAAGSLVIF